MEEPVVESQQSCSAGKRKSTIGVVTEVGLVTELELRFDENRAKRLKRKLKRSGNKEDQYWNVGAE